MNNSLPLLLRSRGEPIAQEDVQKFVDRLSQNIPADVMQETVKRLHDEISDPNYKREESEHFSGEGGGSLEILIKEIFGLTQQIGSEIIDQK